MSPTRPPRLGVLARNPIQYQVPLFREMARRERVRLDVAFLSDDGVRPYYDRSFGRWVAWDADLLDGYPHRFLARRDDAGRLRSMPLRPLVEWIREQDAIVVHGYSRPAMAAAAAVARATGTPYLMRCDAEPDSGSRGLRRVGRYAAANLAVRNAGGGLAIGQANQAFYDRFGARRTFAAPYSVDNDRFAAASAAQAPTRAERLRGLGLPTDRPVAVFSGKLVDWKRPLDLVEAIRLLDGAIGLVVIGDGALRAEVERRAAGLPIALTGFVNQRELPSVYGLGDLIVLPSTVDRWGLVLNEAMACGLLPVVSDRVGAAPDLVDGLGEVYPAGDVRALADSLARAARRLGEPGLRSRIQERIDRYSLAATASGYERAAAAVTS